MANKWMRNYRLVIYAPVRASAMMDWSPSDSITIDYPLALDFEVRRGLQSGVFASAAFKLYNLSAQTRRFLFHDFYDAQNYMRIQFFAGYGDALKLVFDGRISSCYSSRAGVDIVTQIVAQERAYYTPFVSVVFPKGTTRKGIIQSIISNYLMGCNEGTLRLPADEDISFAGYYAAEGNGYYLLNKLTNGKWFQTGQSINVLSDSDTLEGLVQVLSPATGLLNTPKRANSWLQAEVIFSPELILAQKIQLSDEIEPRWNGAFKIMDMVHVGSISPTKAGSATSTLQLYKNFDFGA